MNIFYPDIYAKNIFEIDYEKLKSKGIKCLVFDLDNTLVPVRSSVADEKVKALFATLKKQKFTIILMSNSLKKVKENCANRSSFCRARTKFLLAPRKSLHSC